jgi:3-deoxy-manno-octulosonate cytidylyltransferase (CMP-KDO synthetase)
MKTAAIIPVRMASSRFPGKPLKTICGIPMVGHCYYRTNLVSEIEKVYVATCDKEIANYIKSIGGNVIMTSLNHKRATTRSAEALEKIEEKYDNKFDVIVMVQGDEPLVMPSSISDVIAKFYNSENKIVNLMSLISSKKVLNDKNNVKVVVDNNNNALYFSREAIPSSWQSLKNYSRYMQTGIIAFRRNALFNFNNTEETILEKIESIDMNRVLETGGKIKMVLTQNSTIGVDVPEELIKVEKILANDPITKMYI